MTQEQNVASQQAFGDAVNSGSLDFDDLVAPDSVDHDPGPGQVPGPAGFTALFTELRTAFPDLAIEVDHMTVTDDDVAFAYTVSGTQDGPFLGFDPTGRTMSVRGMQIGRFENGKLVERWGQSDQLGMLQQLGLAPTP